MIVTGTRHSVIYLRLFASEFPDLRAKNVFVIADRNIGYLKEYKPNHRGSDWKEW